ncbi:hypothetical protein ACUXV3_01845 [Roseobacteraceae bacterium NS-SX3]
MTAELGELGMQRRTSLARRASQWIADLPGPKKSEPQRSAAQETVQVPRHELERLAGTSPHLLVDIGVLPADSAGAASPWRLQDGRHLMLRPPL